ncbi:MAG: BamA/TamA family outer membrane protein [Fibrobacter sp.]|nr:BamA/TamA family outer membrane protein [Fibrobacter sp.]
MIRFLTILLLVGVLSVSAHAKKAAKVAKDSSSESMSFTEVISWPFIHIVQPFFGVLVYPISEPLHYAIKNGVIEKTVDLITFGENRNILIYPTFNLKPGTATMLGGYYRHRNLFKQGDYAVLQGSFYANSDIDFKMRYSKQSLFGKNMYGAISTGIYMDRNNVFVIPGSRESFVQADTTIFFDTKLGFPLTESRNLNFSVGAEFDYHIADFSDTKDSVLDDVKYPIADRGLYQSHFEIPVYANLVFDNLDFPYAPSRGNRLSISGSYVFVGKYGGIGRDDFTRAGLPREEGLDDGGKNHDYVRAELFYQIYFFIGRAQKYVLSAKEARKTRKFYTDFSLNEALRVWRPENLVETLFERRVLAFQYRFLGMWEMEKGGAPYTAFPGLNARYPLRGYSGAWSSPFIMGISAEYRWPVDRLVDGVVFDEYAMISDRIDHWSKKNLYNSWGFGVRVRKPDMYLFRIQFAFHGWHGLSMILTIAPEFR